MIRTRILVGVFAALIFSGVHADDRDDDERDLPQFRIFAGAMLSTEQSLYRGGENRAQVLPQLFIGWGRLYVRGPAIGAFLYGDDAWLVSTGIRLDLADTERGKSPQLADMVDLDLVLLGELAVSHEAEWGELELSLAADVSGNHDGYLAGLSFSVPLEAGPLQIEPEFGIEWHSAKVNRYYHGVGTTDATAARPLYAPDAGLNYEIGGTVTYPFADRHSLRLDASTEFVSSEVSDSPIVERSSRARFGIGYIYRF